jgi:hypothetical protein
MSPEEIIKSMEAAPHPFTTDPNNPFTLLKKEREEKEREMREADTDGEL